MPELEQLARGRGAELVPVAGGPKGEEFSRRMSEIAREGDPARISVSFCGASALLKYVQQAMRTRGIPPGNLAYEKFEFR